MNTLTSNEPIVKITPSLWLATDPTILLICVFDRKGEWQLEVIFEGGAKVTGVCNADFVTEFESDLEAQGWQVDASLFSRGFNAKPPVVEEFIFAMPELWPDDLGLSEPTL